MKTLTQEMLKELLEYDPNTGIFRWKNRRGSAKKGAEAGNYCPDGYIEIRVYKKLHKAHRLAWLYMNGEHPSMDIDHIDGNRSNNSIFNLRHVSRLDNLHNQRLPYSRSKTGLIGSWKHSQTGKYTSQIRSDGKKICLGLFDTKEEAHKAYVEAKRKLHATCTI